MGFDFNIGKRGSATVCLSERGFTFNGEAISQLGTPEYIAMGVDKENKKLAIKAVDKSSTEPKYTFANSERRKKCAFVTATNVRAAVLELVTDKPKKGGITYSLEFDKNTKLAIIDLTRGTKSTRKKEG